MARRTATLLTLLGLAAAGCGGGDEDKASTGSDAAKEAATAAAPRASQESSAQGAEQARQEAIDACKRRITTQPGTSPQLKADLEAICEEGASGDENRRREAAEKVCRRLVEESAPPDAAARGPLLKNCEQPAAP